MAWNGDMLASGSRDRSILLRDTRDGVVGGVEKRWTEHKQEVGGGCGVGRLSGVCGRVMGGWVIGI